MIILSKRHVTNALKRYKRKNLQEERSVTYVYRLPEPEHCRGRFFCQGCKTLDLEELQNTFTTEFSAKLITESFAFAAAGTEEKRREKVVLTLWLLVLEQRRIRIRADPINIYFFELCWNFWRSYKSCSLY